jgi:hypothetical protein
MTLMKSSQEYFFIKNHTTICNVLRYMADARLTFVEVIRQHREKSEIPHNIAFTANLSRNSPISADVDFESAACQDLEENHAKLIDD